MCQQQKSYMHTTSTIEIVPYLGEIIPKTTEEWDIKIKDKALSIVFSIYQSCNFLKIVSSKNVDLNKALTLIINLAFII